MADNDNQNEQQNQQPEQAPEQQQSDQDKVAVGAKFDPSQLPVYGGKSVRAVKITGITNRSDGADVLHEHQFPAVPVDQNYLTTHKPQVGGYYVQLDETRAAFVPGDVFEKLYTKA